MPNSAKALVAILTAVLSGLAAVLIGPDAAISDVTTAQWVVIAASGLAAFNAVYFTKNGAKK